MGQRVALHNTFKTIVPNVYFQPPETIKLEYPAIVYYLSNLPTRYADDIAYKRDKAYAVTLIDEDPDNENVEKLLDTFKYIRFDRSYTANDLNHYVFTLYY